MALELIDYLLYFWCLLGGATYLFGQAYERQLQARQAKQTEKRPDRDSRAPVETSRWQHPSSHYDSREKQEEPRQDAAAQTSQQYNVDQWSQVESDTTRPLASQLPTIPTATGFNADCVEWVNSILYLFYSQPDKYGAVVRESINRSLNEKLSNITSSSSELSELMVEFSSPLTDGPPCWPELTNVRTETESDRSVSANCKIYHKYIAFDMTIRRFRQQSTTVGREEQQYELVLENLEGKLKSIAMLADRLIVVQFMDKPDTKISLRPSRIDQASSMTPTLLINEDCLVALILQTISSVVVDLYFGDDSEFPQYTQSSGRNRNKLGFLRAGASELKRQIKHDFLGAISHGKTSLESNKERKALIKVLSALNINYNQTVVCLLELDSPHQAALSSTKQGSNPVWDEHFLFTLGEKSDHITLTLWDPIRSHKSQPVSDSQQLEWVRDFNSSSGKFLGQVRIGIEALRKTPVQKVSLTLEPLQNDPINSVGGELQLELLFLEHSTSDSNSLRKSGSSSSIAGAGEVVSVDRKLTPAGYVITTTTIVKPKKQQQLSISRNPSPISSNQSELDLDGSTRNTHGADSPTASSYVPIGDQRADSSPGLRSRSRSRSLLRAIKKRFSFSRTRSRSVGGGLNGDAQSAQLAAASQLEDLSPSRASSDMSGSARARSVPPGGREQSQSEVPTIVINKSRLSDTASALSFAHPKSQLVIECQETDLDGRSVTRHFAFNEPEDSRKVALANKLRKRGSATKLHLFNEHQFVATRLAGSSTCHLCGRVFSRRPGKQGYKCRNCHLLSHKQCHVKVDHNCPYANRDHSIQLEFIDAEPPASLVRERRANSSSSLPKRSDEVWSSRAPKIGAKSISMDVEDR